MATVATKGRFVVVHPPLDMPNPCGDMCGDDCWHAAFGYPWCRPCGEHHRPPECAIDDQGRSLMSCGCAWSVIEAAGFTEEAHYAPGCYVVREREHG